MTIKILNENFEVAIAGANAVSNVANIAWDEVSNTTMNTASYVRDSAVSNVANIVADVVISQTNPLRVGRYQPEIV